MRRGAVTALTAVLLAGPAVLAFRSGGFFPQARLAAGIGAWAVLGLTVLVVPGPVLPPIFFFNDAASTEIYTLSLHDALPIFPNACPRAPTSRRRTGPTG